MTSIDTLLDTATPATEDGEEPTTLEGSKKHLRGSSDAPMKREMTSVRAPARTKTDNYIPVSAPRSAAGAVSAEQSHPTKASVVEALLTCEGGASLTALCEATGWQPHTCRAFLTGLRKKGREVVRASDKASKSIYLIVPEQINAPLPTAEQAEAGGH